MAELGSEVGARVGVDETSLSVGGGECEEACMLC